MHETNLLASNDTINFKEYARMIPEMFSIKNRRGEEVPFKLNDAQTKYINLLAKDYPDAQGVRENVLKARQQGFSAVIDAIITIDFLIKPNIGAMIVSHKIEETKQLFQRVSHYIDSFCIKYKINRDDLLDTDTQGIITNKTNGSYIIIGTAGAKTLGRGGTLQNIHWSEVGFYPNTDIINAERLVTGAEQQVMTGVGKIWRESTGNMFGDFFHQECERSRKEESSFKFRFFPWFMYADYSINDPAFIPTEKENELMTRHNLTLDQMAWYRSKGSEFTTPALFIREYPTTPDEAFLSSGSSFFDMDTLKHYFELTKEPIRKGFLAPDGGWM